MHSLTVDNLNSELKERSCDYPYYMPEYLKILLIIHTAIVITSVILLCIYLHYHIKCLFKRHIHKTKRKRSKRSPVVEVAKHTVIEEKIKREISKQYWWRYRECRWGDSTSMMYIIIVGLLVLQKTQKITHKTINLNWHHFLSKSSICGCNFI